MLILILIALGLLLVFTDFLKLNLMIIAFIVLALLILICALRICNNEDLIVKNCKSEEDLANIKNAKKVFRKTKTYKYLLILFYVSIIVLLICAFTDYDTKIVDFLSAQLVYEEDMVFNNNYFFIPIYILVIREMLIQVKIGEFLLKYFNTEEEQPEEINLKALLYKKPKVKEKSPTSIPTQKDETELKKQDLNTEKK